MQEEDRVWIDPESLPPMLQESAGGWHTLMTPGKPAPATGVLAEVNALLRRMKEHLNRDQYKEAVEAYEQLLGYAERHPDIWSIRDADTYAELAKAYYRMSKITADGDCSHEIKRLLGRKFMTNLDSIFKSTDITLPTKVCLVKAMVFPVVMYGCES